MTRFIAITLSTLGLLVAGSTASLAQMSRDCDQQLTDICADEDYVSCMSRPGMMDIIGPECVGDVQMMLEMDREARADQGGQDTQDDTMRGLSYGGVLREGPGMEYAKIASMQEGDPIDILEDSGVWFDGYKWYYIQTFRGSGYHWGGIFCVDAATQIEGILDKCY
ncbi:SH3 domain-containing protein [Hoeflea sp.]|uniref:SH3 domain-containing protein n=1 Tax=Hoeflea sp. TaxID=1940281 RepID=UPI001996A726|nr:SH3 domain-containing protein [Hoeflea sp.]MBC7282298.1 SH3 domain-containing protein [Hoeflea sp.]